MRFGEIRPVAGGKVRSQRFLVAGGVLRTPTGPTLSPANVKGGIGGFQLELLLLKSMDWSGTSEPGKPHRLSHRFSMVN